MNLDLVEIAARAARWPWHWTGLVLLCAWGTVAAQPVRTTPTRSLAATCAACHGTDGRAVEVLEGLKAGEQVASKNTFVLKSELGKAGVGHEH